MQGRGGAARPSSRHPVRSWSGRARKGGRRPGGSRATPTRARAPARLVEVHELDHGEKMPLVPCRVGSCCTAGELGDVGGEGLGGELERSEERRVGKACRCRGGG